MRPSGGENSKPFFSFIEREWVMVVVVMEVAYFACASPR